MLKKLQELHEKLEETREEIRKSLNAGDKKAAMLHGMEAEKLEAEMLLIVSGRVRRKVAKLLQLRFIDGLGPSQIQFILGVSHTTYYRLLKEAERS